MKIIPAIDLLEGKVVRLTQGDYSQVQTYPQDPSDLAKFYEDQGATRLHLVDLDGAKKGSLVNLDAIKKIRDHTKIKLEIGGGIRDQNAVTRLKNIGIDYLILGSLLATQFELASDLIHQNPQVFIAGIDVNNETVAIQGWLTHSSISLQDMIQRCNHLPLESLIVTDIATDGMLQGPNLTLLEKASLWSKHPVIASGGVSCKSDLHNLAKIPNISGCIVGKALLSGNLDINILSTF